MSLISRADGRDALEVRSISLKLGQLSRADGSARYASGSTASHASFTGPIEVRLKEELPDKATFEIIHRPVDGVGDTSSRDLEATITSALTPLLSLHQHPRSLIQLTVQSLTSTSSSSSYNSSYDQPEIPAFNSWPNSLSTSDGAAVSSSRSNKRKQTSLSEKCTAINSSGLAILDAGSIAIKAVPVAISLAYLPGNISLDTKGINGMNGTQGDDGDGDEVLVVDPTFEEEGSAKSRMAFGWAFGDGISTVGNQEEMQDQQEVDQEAELIWVESDGSFSQQQFRQAMAQSRISAKEVLASIRQQLSDHLSTQSK